MKYHTTILNSVAALIMLVAVTIVVLLLFGFSLIPDYHTTILEAVQKSLSGSGTHTLSVGSVDTALFNRILLHDVTLSRKDNTQIAEVKTITISVPIYRFISHRIYPKQIPITLEGVSLNITAEDLTLFQNTNDQGTRDPMLSNLIDNSTITISITDANLDYKQDQLAASLLDFTLFISLTDGSVTQGQLQLPSYALQSAELEVQGNRTMITLGGTFGGGVGVRLDAQESAMVIPSHDVKGTLSALQASYVGDSLGQLFNGDGDIATTLDAVDLYFPLDGIPTQFTIPTLAANASLIAGKLMEVETSLADLAVAYQQWSAMSDNLEGTFSVDADNNTSASLTSSGQITLYHDDSSLLTVENPRITFSGSQLSNSIQLNASRVYSPLSEIPESLLGFDLTQLESSTMESVYLLAVQNRVHEHIQLESSVDLGLVTTLPFLQQIEAQVSASLSLDSSLNMLNSQLFLRRLESSDLEGSLDANIIYDTKKEQSPEITIEATHTNGMQLAIDYAITQELMQISLQLNQMKPIQFLPLLESLSTTVAALVVPETSLQGNINLVVSTDLTSGRGTTEIGVANLAVDEQRFNLATTFSGSLDENLLYVDLATLTTEGYRLSYNGSIERGRFVPSGTLRVSSVDSGEMMVAADFRRLAAETYEFGVTSPFVKDSSFDGSVSWINDGTISASGVFSVPQMAYPLSISFTQEAGRITLLSENLTASLDFSSVPGHITFDLQTFNLPLPPSQGSPFYGNGIINGSIAADFSLADELFIITSPNLAVTELGWKENAPFTFSFAFDADPKELRIEDIRYVDDVGEILGYLTIRNTSLRALASGLLDEFSMIGELTGTSDEQVSISFLPDNNHSTRGLLQISNVDIGRFSTLPINSQLQMTFIGETDIHTRAVGHASINLSIEETETTLVSEIHVNEDSIVVDQSEYRKNNTILSIPQARFDYTGQTSVQVETTVLSPLIWRDGNTVGSFTLKTELASASSFFDWLSIAVSAIEEPPPITIEHTNVLLKGMIPWKSGTHFLYIRDNIISVEKGVNGTVEGSYHLDTGVVDVLASDGFPFPMRANGTIYNNRISLQLSEISLDLSHLNAIFAEPIILFTDGHARGELLIDGPLNDPDFYGTLRSNAVDVETFWTTGELFSLKNPVMTVSENLATIAPSTVSAVHESGRRTNGTIQMEFTVEQWGFPHYRIDVLEIRDPVSLWIPIPGIDINVEAMVAGSFSIDGTPTEETLYGDVVVSDGKISFGVPELPIWFLPKTRTSIDMSLRTGRNVSFIFPNEESPILRATFADGQEIGISVEAPLMVTTFSGELAFRSGEIYYVQKNFYITEGSLRFPTISSGLTEDFMPRLNLRARLREFESDGTRVDIYLVLQEARFDNLNPRFESIPLRSTNEILELLGQNIVTAGSANDSGLTSVVAVASAATDVISRLGLLQATTVSLGFSSIIRESLGLDVFTIRTNLLQNILLEAIPGIAADTTVSPVARYLDNTTMYLGKYLSDDFYLQGMLHFRQDVFGKSTSFLANDLRIDTEVSVEWSNPLATFSFFTQPEELSVFDLFDTMGFSITKRFDF